MKKLFLSLATCAAMLSASASDTWQLGPYAYQADTLFHVTAGPGITTTGVRLSTNTNKTNIFYSTIDLTNPDLELRGVQAKDNGDVIENVNAMGVRKNKQGNGQYIAGVNGDFFNMGGSPTRTNGHSLADGVLYNAGIGGTGWINSATYATVEGKKDIRLLQGIQAAKTLKFPDGQTHSYHINGGRWDNYLVIYTSDSTSTGTNIWGRECTMKLVSGTIANGDAVFEITSPWEGKCDGTQVGNMTVPEGGYVLSGVGQAYAKMEQLKVGDKVSLGTEISYNGKAINPTQMIGGCSYIVTNGKIAPDVYFTYIDHFASNQARTVIGYNEDRTKLIILVADKYAKYATVKEGEETVTKVKDPEKLSYGTSTGMLLQRMGHIMLHLGCYTAMNFDGGGSSQLYNKELGICNIPYGDTYLRPVANGFFAVSTTPVDNEIASLEVRQKNVKLAKDSIFTPTVYGYNKYGVLVNSNVTGYTLTVAPSLGTVSTEARSGEPAFVAGDAKGTTVAVISLGDIKCGMRVLTNGGGEYVTSGDDNAPIMVSASYESDEPMGFDKEPIYLTEQWHFVNSNYNDGWDGTAPNWASEDAIKAKPCPRFATARNGRFYTVDMTTMSIAEIDPEGNIVPKYKLPSLEGRVINDVPDYYGCAISSDDYGHFLIGHLFTKNDTYRVWTVYDPKTGKAKHFEIELPEDELSSGRIDNIGRVVGDLTSDAYVYVAPKATNDLKTNKALIIHFEGQGDLDNVTATPTMSQGLYMAGAGNTGSTIQPKYATVAEMAGKDLNDTFYWYSKAAGLGQHNQDLFTFENGNYSTNYCNDWNNESGLNGFDTFIMGGKRYFVVGFAEAGEKRNNQHIVVMDEQSNRVAEWINPDYTSGAGYITITAVPVNANQINIYLYNCTGDYYVGETKTGAIAGALLTLTLGSEYEAYEPVDITPAGYNFDNYEDGQEFKLTATNATGTPWTAPAGMFHSANPNAFDKDGHLTVYVDRGGSDNSDNFVKTFIQPAVTVREMTDKSGKVLVLNEGWSPYGFDKTEENGTVTPALPSYAKSASPQLNFYINSDEITEKPDQRHYVRVKMVYNIMRRGCHHYSDVTNGTLKPLASIYSTHENNWVMPVQDNLLGEHYGDTGIDFAKWVDEGNNSAEIAENPEVYVPADDELDPFDFVHAANTNHKQSYLINPDRYRVYEFDTYIDNPSTYTTSIQLSMNRGCATYSIKEIKFIDLGTDEAAATLLNRRQKGWIYADEFSQGSSGIEDIVTDETIEGSDAPAVYYNLQGVQVKNPENGIYIVRRGNKVTKELIR